jgi:hypothetical protein
MSLFFAPRVQTRRASLDSGEAFDLRDETSDDPCRNLVGCTHDEYTAIQEPGTSNSRDLRKQALTTGDTVRGE